MKKTFRKLAIALFVLTAILCFSVTSFAAEESLFAQIEVADTQMDFAVRLDGDNYYLFLPTDAKSEEVKFIFDSETVIAVDGEQVDTETAIDLSQKEEYAISINGSSNTLYVLQSKNLPSLHITTESGSLKDVHANKEHKEPATIVIADNGEIVVDASLEYIKGRGNATWTFDKKPYNIKFDKKTNLFGMGKAKKWTLLANYVDTTILRNSFALSLAEKVGIPFTSEFIHVDLFVNNEYCGAYTLCESVEVGETRVDIVDLEKETEEVNPDVELDELPLGGDQTKNPLALQAGTQKWVEIPNDPADITGGYLLEYDLPTRYVGEVSGFVTERSQPLVLKAPECASEAQVKYISALYQEFEDAVYSETGYNSLNKHYSEYIDVESFVRMYVFQEYVKNIDAALSSFYIYKDSSSDKFVAAPVWDFDNAFGQWLERFGLPLYDSDDWWASVMYHWETPAIDTLPTILNALCKHEDFRDLASVEWNQNFAPAINEESIADFEASVTEILDSATMNAVRWNIFSTNIPSEAEYYYLHNCNNVLIKFILERKEFLDKGFAEDSARLYYEANGGYGNMYNENIHLIGETAKVKENTFTHSSLIFDCWNTKADGSGQSYNAGDDLVFSEKTVTLYAQWKTAEAEEPDEPDDPVVPDEPDVPDVPDVPADPDVPVEQPCTCKCHSNFFISFIYKIVNFIRTLFGYSPCCACN